MGTVEDGGTMDDAIDGTVDDVSDAAETGMPAPARPKTGRSVTSRALTILEAFDHRHRSLTLSEIARRAHLPLATAHRLVAELVLWQALERSPDGAYRIGARLWGLGALSDVEAGLHEAAAPVMADLFAATGENVHLAVRDGVEALYISKISGRRSVPIVSGTGARLPLHATAVGKVLLTWCDDQAVAATAMRSLTRVTPYTIVSPARLRRDLDAVRDRGWALTVEEMTLGSWSIAAPVRQGDEVVAAIGIVGRSNRRDLRRFVPALLEAVRDAQVRLARSTASPTLLAAR